MVIIWRLYHVGVSSKVRVISTKGGLIRWLKSFVVQEMNNEESVAHKTPIYKGQNGGISW